MCKHKFLTHSLHDCTHSPSSWFWDGTCRTVSSRSFPALLVFGTCSWKIIFGEPGAVNRRDILGWKFTSRSKLSPENIASTENIASSQQTATGSPKILKGWPEISVIFRLQPNHLGIKLRVRHDWDNRQLKNLYKTTNKIRGRRGRGRALALLFFCLGWVQY